jgi:hypothetical protein
LIAARWPADRTRRSVALIANRQSLVAASQLELSRSRPYSLSESFKNCFVPSPGVCAAQRHPRSARPTTPLRRETANRVAPGPRMRRPPSCSCSFSRPSLRLRCAPLWPSSPPHRPRVRQVAPPASPAAPPTSHRD